jgi:F-box-like
MWLRAFSKNQKVHWYVYGSICVLFYCILLFLHLFFPLHICTLHTLFHFTKNLYQSSQRPRMAASPIKRRRLGSDSNPVLLPTAATHCRDSTRHNHVHHIATNALHIGDLPKLKPATNEHVSDPRSYCPFQKSGPRCLDAVPSIVWYKVFDFLDISSLLQLSCVSRQWSVVVDDDLFWKSRLIADIGVQGFSMVQNHESGWSAKQLLIWHLISSIPHVRVGQLRDVWISIARQRKRKAIQAADAP